MYDFEKEFKKKTSVNFWRRRIGNGPAMLCIHGGNDDHYAGLKPEYVVRLMTQGISEANAIAQELGCTNTHLADFFVEFDTVYNDFDPYESGGEMGADVYYLIAKER